MKEKALDRFYVYRWIRLDTNQIFYIGKGEGKRSTKISTRNPHFTNIYKKVPCKSEIFIDSLNEDQAFTKEIEFIAFYRSCGISLVNMTDGGEGRSGSIISQLTKKKLSNVGKTRYINQEERIKTSLTTKQALTHSCSLFDVYLSVKKNSLSKGEFVGTWENQTQCGRDLNIDPKSINAVLIGRYKQCKGYVFIYKDQELQDQILNQIKITQASKKIPFRVYGFIKKNSEQKGEYIGTWSQQRQCSEDLRIPYQGICHALKKKQKSAYGYIFEYCD